MTTTDAATEATASRLAQLRDRLGPAARKAGSIAWILLAGLIGFTAGGLAAYGMAHNGTFAGLSGHVLIRLAAAEAGLLAFMAVCDVPHVWRWARNRARARGES